MHAEELIEKMLNRDRTTLDWVAAVFLEKSKKVYWKNQLNKNNFWELKDLAQISFEKFWELLNEDSRKEIKNLEGFIYRLIHFQSLKLLRYSDKSKMEDSDTIEKDDIMGEQSFEEQLIKREKARGRAKLFRETLQSMAQMGYDLCVKIITMNFDRKISDKEAELMLNMKAGNLRFERRKCKKKLNQLMRKSSDFQHFTSKS